MDVLNLNKQKLTHIVIIIFILLSLTYLYNMNTNPSHTNPNPNPNTTKTITENFMVLTEDQELGANNVMIDNLTQVNFVAGGNDNMTINFADPTTEWPVNLQQLFDSKLDNNGVVGGFVAGNNPLQGIVLNDKVGKSLVKIGDNIPFGPATEATTITHNAIQFGGTNITATNDTYSAQISIDVHQTGSLCLVGMNKAGAGRNIDMWVDSGRLKINGPVNITGAGTIGGALNVTGAGTIGGALNVTGTGTFDSTGTFGSSLSCVTNLKMTGSGNSGIGGALQIINTDKTGSTEAYAWNIYNMRNYGSTNTSGPGKTGSGLSFWRYCKAGCGSGLCNVHMTLNDDGSTYFASDINVAGELGVATTIRKTRANGANLHVVSDQNLFLMAKDNVYIYKCTSDCAAWDNSSGNLIVQGNCTVNGKIYANGGIDAATTLIKTNHIVQAGGMETGWLHVAGTDLTVGGNRMFGIGQSWNNKTSERTFNTTYRNNWNCAMMLNITINFNTYNDVLGDGPHVILVVNGHHVQECYQFRHDQNYRLYSMSSIVGAGQEYYIYGASSQNFNPSVLRGWYEYY